MDLALLRLVAQRVAGPKAPDPVTAARHLLAAQGQDLRGVLRSIALRTAGGDPADVIAAFDAGTLVRSWPMRGTLHVVPAEDLGWMLRLMTDRPRAAAARRQGQLGLDGADLDTCAAVLADRLATGPASRAEVFAALEAVGQPTAKGRGYHVLVELAQRGAACLGPFRDGDQLFTTPGPGVTGGRDLAGEEALAELALRYLLGHGPATDADLARWSGLPLGQVRTGLAAVADRLTRVEHDGVTYWLDPQLPDLLAAHRAEARAVHLLPGFDEIVLGYADRSATVPPAVADRLVPGGNGVFRATVLHRGVAVGTWSRARSGIQVTPFGPWPATLHRAVEVVARQY